MIKAISCSSPADLISPASLHLRIAELREQFLSVHPQSSYRSCIYQRIIALQDLLSSLEK